MRERERVRKEVRDRESKLSERMKRRETVRESGDMILSKKKRK